MFDPRNTHEKKFLTHEIPTRKGFGLTKYPREKVLDPRRHDGTAAQDLRDSRWHNTRNLAHSKMNGCSIHRVLRQNLSWFCLHTEKRFAIEVSLRGFEKEHRFF